LRGLSRGLLPVVERGVALSLRWRAIPSGFLISKVDCRRHPVPFNVVQSMYGLATPLWRWPPQSKHFWFSFRQAPSPPILPSSGKAPPFSYGSSILPYVLSNPPSPKLCPSVPFPQFNNLPHTRMVLLLVQSGSTSFQTLPPS
jgi:hypothetical protein